MTIEVFKIVLNEKCNESWETLKEMEKHHGQNSMQAQKALSIWVTYADLFRELYHEEPIYNFSH